MIIKNRITTSSRILLSLAVLLTFTCKTPTDPEPSIFPLIPETGPVKMLVFQNASGLSTYNLLTGEKQLFLEPGPVPNPNPDNYPYFRNAIGSAIWHPDGKSVVYEESYGLDIQHLQSIDMLTGKFLFGLGRGGSNAYLGDISGDGKTLVFGNSIYGPDGNHEIFSMSMDDLIRTQLTYRPGYWDARPTIHPNGSGVLFQSNAYGIDPSSDSYFTGVQLFHVTLDGTPPGMINLEGAGNGSPDINKITGEIVFTRATTSDSWNTIWKASNMSFTNLVQLTDSSSAVFGRPRWSNDGSKIVYTRWTRESRTSPFTRPEIWMMNPDGTEQSKLVNGRHGDLYIRE